jgi:hypothetical protein
LIRVFITLGSADTLADDLLSADALLFLISCLLSYWALRSRGLRRMHGLEKFADALFIIAMIGMVVVLRRSLIRFPFQPGKSLAKEPL